MSGCDASGWWLPNFVDSAICRDDLAERAAAGRGIGSLHTNRSPAVGQQAAVEVHLFGDLGWGIVKGDVRKVAADGRLTVSASLTSDGPDLLDRRWSLVLRRDPQTFAGAWHAVSMTSEGVVSVPRLWPRSIVDRLRASGDLLCTDQDVDQVCAILRAESLKTAEITTPRECAAFTARVLSRALERAPCVEEIFVGVEDLTAILIELWAKPEEPS